MMKKLSPRFVLPLLAVTLSAGLVHAQDGAKKSKAPKGKPQTALALKGTFATIPASDPMVKKAFPATNLAGAKKLIDKPVMVTGTVAKIFVSKSNKVVLLNFAKDYKTAVSAAIKAADFGKFPDLTKLEGKKVLLDGRMVLYKGVPEVELTKVGAIKVIK